MQAGSSRVVVQRSWLVPICSPKNCEAQLIGTAPNIIKQMVAFYQEGVSLEVIDPVAEIEVIAAIYTSSRSTMSFLPSPPDHRTDMLFLRRFLTVRMSAIAIVIRGHPVGVMVSESREIHLLHTARGYSGMGFGSKLIQHAKSQAEELALSCFAANERAVRFYERHGFHLVGLTDGSENQELLPVARYLWVRNGDAEKAA